jgi:hypothetical protein
MMRRVFQDVGYRGKEMLYAGDFLNVNPGFSHFSSSTILLIQVFGMGFPVCAYEFRSRPGSVTPVMVIAHGYVGIAGAVRFV